MGGKRRNEKKEKFEEGKMWRKHEKREIVLGKNRVLSMGKINFRMEYKPLPFWPSSPFLPAVSASSPLPGSQRRAGRSGASPAA